MTPTVLALLLLTALTVSAFAGPSLLRRAAPLLMRVPRLAIALLVGSMVAWAATAFAVGPLLAWVVTGPVILPDAAGEVCRRCLDAANPFGIAEIGQAVPSALLLILPALAFAALAVGMALDLLRGSQRTRETSQRMRERGATRAVQGHRLLVVDDVRTMALALPRRHGGIVLSTGTLSALDDAELAAVLAHEGAHLQQHHHGIATFAGSLARHLRWVPLISAAEEALGHYLEIAADDAARDAVGTPALVSALLKLGEHSARESHEVALEGALHMFGPSRIRHLVQPAMGTAGMVPTVFATVCFAALGLLAASVYLPYLVAGLTGC